MKQESSGARRVAIAGFCVRPGIPNAAWVVSADGHIQTYLEAATGRAIGWSSLLRSRMDEVVHARLRRST